MKNFCAVFALFCVMFLFTACGGDGTKKIINDQNSDDSSSETNDSDSDPSSQDSEDQNDEEISDFTDDSDGETDTTPDDADSVNDNADSGDDEDFIDPDVTDTGETVGETRVADCTGLPENAGWNTVSAIVQTWNGEKWVPSSVASFDLEGSEEECRFKCDTNYGWNGSHCSADVKNAYCDAKPENSVWNDGGRNGTFAQTWNGSSWLPASHAAVYSKSEVECGFVCATGYIWDGSECETAPTQTVECTGLPLVGAEWNTASTITQTWDGEKWVPESTTGVYNENPSNDECRFKCKDHYSWKNSECTADKKNSPCMNLPTNGQWNTAVSIEQTWSGSDWQPSTTGVYSESASTKECRFVCKTNYKWNASTSKCDPETNVENCTGKPENSVWNGSGKFEQTWTNSGWYPASYEATYNKTAGTCTFICDTGFIWDETGCVSAPTREAACQDKPENTVWNTVDKITQTYNGSDWEPSTTPAYNEEGSTKECRFKCASAEYTWNGTSCTSGGSSTLPECSSSSGTPCKDSLNGLIWSASSSDTMNWSSAKSYCKNYSEGGLSSWHLPTIDELKTLLIDADMVKDNCLVSETNNCLALDGCWSCSTCTQTGTQSSSGTGCDSWGTSYSDGRYSKFGETGYFWSSSIQSDVSNSAWYVGFSSGVVNSNRISYSDNVRCVRCEDGYFWNGEKCTVLPDCSSSSGTPCKDSSSGLTWSARASNTMSWSSAKSYCENYSEGGLGEWYLPTISELRTLLINADRVKDNCQVSEMNNCLSSSCWSCSTCTQTGIQSSSGTSCYSNSTSYDDGRYSKFGETGKFWSSSSMSSSSAWDVDFGSGNVMYDSTSFNYNNNSYNNYDVRCVRRCEDGYFWNGLACVNPCKACVNSANSTKVCSATSLNDYTCDCEEGYFWNGEACIANPCQADSCIMDHAINNCQPRTETTFECVCEENYFWNGSSCTATPCDPNPCLSVANSTQECSVSGGATYKCECTSDYYWDGTLCGTVQTRTAACTGLISNTEWNTVSEIIQKWDDYLGTWVPTSNGSYNQNPSTNQCRFKCIENYFWNGSKCVTPCVVDLSFFSYNPCGQGTCTAINITEYSCECDENYFFDSDSGECVNPCDTCSTDSNSTGECSATSLTDFSCECKTGSTWNESESKCLVDPDNLPECSPTSATPCYDSTSHLTWSKKSDTTYTWSHAVTYCDNLTEGGYSDWRLPNINELRTLIQNCSATQFPQIGEESCGITHPDHLSYNDDWNSACNGCTYDENNPGQYSKFGDTGWFLSSSTRSDISHSAWYVLFDSGGVRYGSEYGGNNVRCVR